MFLDRYVVFISIGYYFLIAIAVSFLGKKKWVFYSLSFMVVFLMAVSFNPRESNKRKIKEVVQTIKNLKTKESVVVICPSWLDLGFVYYYNPGYFKDYKNLKSNLNKDRIFSINNIDQVDTALLATSSNVIYLEEWATLVDKENQILRQLRRRSGIQKELSGFEPFHIYNFAR